MTQVREAINQAASALDRAGIGPARLEAELLLSRATGWPRPVVLIDSGKPVPHEALEAFSRLVERRCRREPLQQIVGETEFFGLKILVDSRVMSPRPDTETLVETVLKNWRPDFRTVLEIGAGSGAVLVALAKNLEGAEITATDLSPGALELAMENVRLHGLDERVRLIKADVFPADHHKYDIIVSNPPYIPSAEIDALMPEVARYEPRLALDGGADGLDLYRRIIQGLPKHIGRPGLVAFEVGLGQAGRVSEIIAGSLPDADLAVIMDLAGVERVVVAQLH